MQRQLVRVFVTSCGEGKEPPADETNRFRETLTRLASDRPIAVCPSGTGGATDLRGFAKERLAEVKVTPTEHPEVVIGLSQAPAEATAACRELPGFEGPVRVFEASLPAGKSEECARAVADSLAAFVAGLQIVPGKPEAAGQLKVGGLSWIGTGYSRNMDCAFWSTGEYRGVPVALLAVADGIGSEADGDVAARITLGCLAGALGDVSEELSRSAPTDGGLGERVLRGRYEKARTALREESISRLRGDGRSVDDPSRAWQESSLGTTLVAALVVGERLTVCWAGDSRAYRLREGGLTLLTRDHSVAVREIGVSDPDEIGKVREGRALTNALHPAMEGPPDVASWDLTGGDVLLVCSDGVYEGARKHLYLQALMNLSLVKGLGPGGVAEDLVRTLWGEEADNVTALVAFAGVPSSVFLGPELVEREVFQARDLSSTTLTALNGWEAWPKGVPPPPPGVPRYGPWPALNGFWRCPSCGESGEGGHSPDSCPACGKGELETGPWIVTWDREEKVRFKRFDERAKATVEGESPPSGEIGGVRLELAPEGFLVSDMGSDSGAWSLIRPESPSALPAGHPVRLGGKIVTVLSEIRRDR